MYIHGSAFLHLGAYTFQRCQDFSGIISSNPLSIVDSLAIQASDLCRLKFGVVKGKLTSAFLFINLKQPVFDYL